MKEKRHMQKNIGLPGSRMFRGACTIFSFLFVAVVVMYFFHPISLPSLQKTGLAASASGLGCCDSFCDQSFPSQCRGTFFVSNQCSGLGTCNVGCCITAQGYCLSNYLKGNCARAGGTFSADECSEIVQCLVINESSLISPTGINLAPNIFYPGFFRPSGEPEENTSVLGTSAIAEYASAEPFAGNIGTFFTIRYFSRENKAISSIEAAVIYQGYTIKSLNLYDDGMHNDGMQGDGFYANVWDSSSVNSFNGVWPVSVDISMIYSDRTSKMNKDASRFTIIGQTACKPLKRINSNQDSVNIIFMPSNYNSYGGISKFSEDVAGNLRKIRAFSPFAENEDNLNYFAIEKDSSIGSEIEALRITVAECNLYNPARDVIIVYDNDQQSCARLSYAGNHIFSLNPLIMIEEGRFSLESFVQDACGVLVTFADKADGYISGVPQASILTPDASVFDSNNINISFMITDSKDARINYTLFVGSNSTSGTALNSTETSAGIWVDNGTYPAYIFAIDSDGNPIESGRITIAVNGTAELPEQETAPDVENPEEGVQE